MRHGSFSPQAGMISRIVRITVGGMSVLHPEVQYKEAKIHVTRGGVEQVFQKKGLDRLRLEEV